MNQPDFAARLRSPIPALRPAVAAVVLALGAGLTFTAAAYTADGAARDGRPGQHAMHAGKGGPGMMGPGLSARALDAVGATDEQKAQIRQIMQSARSDLQAQRESGQALREQMRAQFAQPTIDAGAIEALRQQMLARHDQSSRRMTQALVEASQVLTPDQRQALAQQMQQQRQERGSARGERRQDRQHKAPARS
jgi:Spy/CpxP family protein refolding chaperone